MNATTELKTGLWMARIMAVAAGMALVWLYGFYSILLATVYAIGVGLTAVVRDAIDGLS